MVSRPDFGSGTRRFDFCLQCCAKALFPGGVTVAQRPLEPSVLIRIQAGEQVGSSVVRENT